MTGVAASEMSCAELGVLVGVRVALARQTLYNRLYRQILYFLIKGLSMAQSSSPSPAYQVPALDKGLDILEHLAAEGIPLTQTQLARALGRGPNELFRMLVCLERRGYIGRDPASGAYSLTLRLFTLAHAHSPFQGLLRAAERPMRELTEEVRESCHLSVRHRSELLVLGQEESPRKLRLSVEVGAVFPLLHTVSGRLLLAYLEPGARNEAMEANPEYGTLTSTEQGALRKQLDTIRARGYEEAYGETMEGVLDLAVLVGTPDIGVQAALTIASLGRRHGPRTDELLPVLQRCAHQIGRSAGLIA